MIGMFVSDHRPFFSCHFPKERVTKAFVVERERAKIVDRLE